MVMKVLYLFTTALLAFALNVDCIVDFLPQVGLRNVMASSSSESDTNHYNDEVRSSPLDCWHNATDIDSNGSKSDESLQSYDSRSPQSSPCKRPRNKLNPDDPSVEEETQERQELGVTNQESTSNLNIGSGADQSTSQQYDDDFQDSSDNEFETDSSSDNVSEAESSEAGNSAAELTPDDSDCNAVNSPRNSPAYESDSDGNSDDSDINEALFSGSAKTTDEAVLDICNLFLKHRWSKASLGDTLKVMASTLPQPNNMPHSLATLKNYLNLSSLPCSKIPYYYCSVCLQLKESQATHCEEDISGVFFYFSVVDQLRFLFESDNLSHAVDNYRNARSNATDTQKKNLCDILDGTEYKRVRSHVNGPYDITLAWNTDGVSLSDSSDVKLYPILTTICEVAPGLRSHYLMVNAVWVDVCSPKMSAFLKPFADELNETFKAGGFDWKHPESGTVVKSQVVAPLFIGDAPVRGDVLEVMRYNAIRGCEKCEAKAVKLPPKGGKGRSLRRFVFSETPAPERTARRMRLQGRRARETGEKHVKGVKGKSIVQDFPLLDRACCTLAEYMHCVALGVARHFAELWFTKPGPWYIGNCKTAVDAFLLSSVKVLDFMRDARKITKLSQFKESEFRSWLLFFSLPALQQAHFPHDYFQHWTLLVKSVYLLLKDEISESDLKTAEVMLRCFLRDIGKLYSDYDYVYNVHQLSHLTKYVSQWGPLDKTSAFLFENYNGVLSRMLHGTKHQAVELTENLKLARGIHMLNVKVQNRSNGNGASDSVVSVCGQPNKITLTNDDLRILRSAGISDFKTYRRVSFKGIVYTWRDYDLKKKKCNSLVEFHDANGEKCKGEILCFVQTAAGVFSYVEKFRVLQSELIFHRETMQKIAHLLPVARSNTKVLVELHCIICKVFKVGQYIAFLPNRYEKKL